ncbi:hypothetical protein BJV82DRAFT_676126 [Fennellomyces sp. T-0311]|nr:hypothetical protein BJV82DRAFT_676126 [Fennellomyces sp. T-0311]
MRFPKYHAMWKYVYDIEQLGCVDGYSTQHSESQHKLDAKQPAQRTNYRRDTFTTQMGEYIMYRDLLYDEYDYVVSEKAEADSTDKIITAPPAKYTLSSVLNNGNAVPFDKIQEMRPDCQSNIYRLTRKYLDILENASKRQRYKNWPKPDTKEVKIYECLKIVDIDNNEMKYEEFVRASPEFHKRLRFDYIQLKDKSIVQVLLLFTLRYTSSSLAASSSSSAIAPSNDLSLKEVFLCRRFTPVDEDEVHASGMKVIEQSLTKSETEVIDVVSVDRISRIVHVVPDFSTSLNNDDGSGVYDKFLVNHDIDSMHWSYGAQKSFKTVPGKLKEWTNVVNFDDQTGDDDAD